jgi:hypothetical protein
MLVSTDKKGKDDFSERKNYTIPSSIRSQLYWDHFWAESIFGRIASRKLLLETTNFHLDAT